MSKYNNEVYNFVQSSIDEDLSRVFNVNLQVLITLNGESFEHIGCNIQDFETFGEYGVFCYIITIESENKELNRLLNYKSFRSDGKYCSMKYRNNKLIIKNKSGSRQTIEITLD